MTVRDDSRRRSRPPRPAALSRRPLAVTLAVLGCLPLAVAAVWLLPWPAWPIVLLVLGGVVWGVSLATLLVEENLERTGSHGLVDGFARLRGAIGAAMTDLAPSGVVKVAGEMWSARTADGLALRRGSAVAIVGAHDFELLVEVVPDPPVPDAGSNGAIADDPSASPPDASPPEPSVPPRSPA